MRILVILFLGIVLLFAGASPTASMALIGRPIEPGGGPTEVRIQAALLDVDEIDASTQSFTANFFLAARWVDERLAHKGPGRMVRPLDEVWNPQMQAVNLERISTTFRPVVAIDPDGTVLYRQRAWGSFAQAMDLREFPFDHQSFEIRIVAAGHTPKEVKWVPDPDRRSGLAPKLSLADWEIGQWRLDISPYEPLAGESLASFAFVLEAKRKVGFFIWKILIPLIFIVAMSWIVFWIDPGQTGTQIGVATTSMLTLIAYRFVIGGLLPRISYLTRMDYFILGSTLLVFASLVQAVVTALLAGNQQVQRARRIDHWCRGIFPALFVALLMYSFVL